MKRTLLLITLFLTTPLWAARWIVPAAANVAGASNTKWKTDLRLVNPDAGRTVTAKVFYLNAGTDNAALAKSVEVAVPASGQVVLEDVLASSFATVGTGALLVDAPSPLIVTSRTFNDTGSATYGQFLPGVPTEAATGAVTHIVYLAKSSEYRTNVGFAGTTAAAGSVTVTLFDASNVRLGEGTFPIAPYGHTQVNDIFASTGSAPAAAARAEVTATVPVVAYGSVIDNRTGDPIAIIAQAPSQAANDLTIPAVAHANGANDSVWRSDIRLFNPGSASASVTLTYHPSAGAPVTRVITVGAKQTAVLDDIVASTFAQAGVGALRISGSSELLAASRTYNALPGGTFGQDIRAMAGSELVTSSQVAVLSGLTNVGYRTNLGLFNVSSEALQLQLELRGADGAVIGTRTQQLNAQQMVQLNDLFAILGVSTATTGTLTIATTSGTGSYAAYASVVDNVSGDPVYVPASIVATPAAGGDCAVVPFVTAGLRVGYTANSSGMISTWETTIKADSAERFELHDVVRIPGVSTSTVESEFDFEVANGMRLIRHMVSDADVNASGFPITVRTEMTFTPSLPTSPLPGTEWCVGRTWSVPDVTTRVVVSGSIPGSTTTVSRGATSGEVLAIETLNTQAGPIRAVKIRTVNGSSDASVEYSLMWYSIDHGIFVRQENYAPGGGVVSTMEVTEIH